MKLFFLTTGKELALFLLASAKNLYLCDKTSWYVVEEEISVWAMRLWDRRLWRTWAVPATHHGRELSRVQDHSTTGCRRNHCRCGALVRKRGGTPMPKLRQRQNTAMGYAHLPEVSRHNVFHGRERILDVGAPFLFVSLIHSYVRPLWSRYLLVAPFMRGQNEERCQFVVPSFLGVVRGGREKECSTFFR